MEQRLSREVPLTFAAMRRGMLVVAALSFGALALSSPAVAHDVIAVAVQGDPGPADPQLSFIDFDEPMVNGRGDVAFGGTLSNFNSGIYFKSADGPLEKIAQGGDQVFGGSGTLTSGFDGPALNNSSKGAGTVIFATNSIAGSGPTAALFQKKPGSPLTALVKQGDPVPGKHGVFDFFDDMAINNRGDVAFNAGYIENTIPKFGVFLRTATGKLVAILLDGAKLPIAGCPKCKYDGTQPYGAEGPWVNDRGLVAFGVTSVVGGPTCIDPENNSPESCFDGSVFARRGTGSILPFVVIGDSLPSSIGGKVETVGLGRPALDVDDGEDDLTFLLNGSMIVSKQLGSKKLDVCAKTGDSAAGADGTLAGFSVPTVSHEVIEFNAELEGNPDPAITNGIFACKGGSVTTLVAQTDPNPRGGEFAYFEEGSIGAPFAVFLHELTDAPDPNADFDTSAEGVYRVEGDN